MDQTSGTNPQDAQEAQGPQESQPVEAIEGRPGFRARGRARRRARFLRRARELAYRDLGGLVYNLHRFGARNDALVLAKLSTLSHIDDELRAIETALQERQPVTVLREAGITACPRCAAIHGSEDRFCPNCGLPMSRHADLPVAGAPAGEPAQPAAPPQQPAAAQQPAWPQQPVATQQPPWPQQPATPPQPPGTTGVRPPAGATPAGTAQPEPGTRQHRPLAEGAPLPSAPTPPGDGRSPLPPVRASPAGGTPSQVGSTANPEEPTEIVRPPTPGS